MQKKIKHGQVKLVVDMSKSRIKLSLVADCKQPFAWDLKSVFNQISK